MSLGCREHNEFSPKEFEAEQLANTVERNQKPVPAEVWETSPGMEQPVS